MFSKELSHAAIERYGVVFRDQVKDHFGCYGRRVETIYNGQIGQKNVHGGTQGWADEDGDRDEQVTCQCDQLGDEKHSK